MKNDININHITHVEITQNTIDFEHGGIQLAGIYPVEDVYPRTQQISYWPNIKHGGKEMTRRLKVNPSNQDNPHIKFHTK
mgnify:CR=1 FL=1